MRERQVDPIGDGKIALRRFPYPYKAALAICSDIDQTKNVDEFLEIQRFLCTKKLTSMGKGVGLEIGNSFFFYDNEGDFSYFSHDERARRVIIDLMRAGYIDCLHSYGVAAKSRDAILRALDVLHKENCKLDVWVNHASAPSNFGRKFEYMLKVCQGDNPNSNVYHADVTLDYGIRFAWVGATTRMIGQSPANSQFPPATTFDPRFPLRSLANVTKEMRKIFLGKLGDPRYTIHGHNRLMQLLQLEDGRKIHEFMRYCNHPASISQGATSRGLAYAISRRVLKYLKSVQGLMIVYTHLGKNSDCRQVIAEQTQQALRGLERDYRDGEIYVTTTSKLLNYYRAREYIVWSHQEIGNQTRIEIKYLDDPLFGRQSPTVEQLQGVTFTVPDSHNASIYLQGVEVKGIQRNPADDAGMESITIPLNRLSYPY